MCKLNAYSGVKVLNTVTLLFILLVCLSSCPHCVDNITMKMTNHTLNVLHNCILSTDFLCYCQLRCHLQILISPNPALATKSALLPWSGQIYVQCDGQQKVQNMQE